MLSKNYTHDVWTMAGLLFLLIWTYIRRHRCGKLPDIVAWIMRSSSLCFVSTRKNSSKSLEFIIFDKEILWDDHNFVIGFWTCKTEIVISLWIFFGPMRAGLQITVCSIVETRECGQPQIRATTDKEIQTKNGSVSTYGVDIKASNSRTIDFSGNPHHRSLSTIFA